MWSVTKPCPTSTWKWLLKHTIPRQLQDCAWNVCSSFKLNETAFEILLPQNAMWTNVVAFCSKTLFSHWNLFSSFQNVRMWPSFCVKLSKCIGFLLKHHCECQHNQPKFPEQNPWSHELCVSDSLPVDLYVVANLSFLCNTILLTGARILRSWVDSSSYSWLIFSSCSISSSSSSWHSSHHGLSSISP